MKSMAIVLSFAAVIATALWLKQKSEQTGTQDPAGIAETQEEARSPATESGQAQKESRTDETTEASRAPAGCITQTFIHERLESHEDGERCLLHKNIIRLARDDYDSKSLCVRVNGKPVEFKRGRKKDEIQIAAVAGPKAEIRASYCFGGSSCKQNCKVQKDDFMAAIGALGTTDAVAAGWDEGAADDVSVEVEKQISRELAQAGEGVFRGWKLKTKTEGCTK